MSDDHADLVSQMYWLVAEGGYLHEAPLGAVDNPGPNQTAHGPFGPADCARVLSGWASRGWLVFLDDGYRLSDREGQDLAKDFARWTRDEPVQVDLSEIGARISREEMRRQAEMGAVPDSH
jgi:hypothetical protein